MTKTVTIKKGKPKAGEYEIGYTLQTVIDMVWGTVAHIHEGDINADTGYPKVYYVCYDDCK